MIRRHFTTSTKLAQVKVWWDSSCPLCRREINFIRRLDREGRITFIPLLPETGEVVQINGCPKTKKELLARFHAEEDGQLVSGAAAFAIMWRNSSSRVLRRIGILAERPSVLWILEKMYISFLVVRPQIQKMARRLES